MSRSYSEKTLKILFALSGDQCAHPDCTEAIIQPGTEQSDALVVGQIAHIYAVKDNGPRGDPDLTQEQRNAHENLILLCPTHHRIVDGQHETYPAVMLIDWKEQHEARMQPALVDLQTQGMAVAALSQTLIDREIDEQLRWLRRARFFVGFDAKNFAWRLANRIKDGDLLGGSASVRARLPHNP